MITRTIRIMAGSGASIVAATALASPPDLRTIPTVLVDRDDVSITETCRILIGPAVIADDDDDGVIHVATDGITLEFGPEPLRGTLPGAAAHQRSGIGIRVDAKNVTIRGGNVHGFRVGVLAEHADGLVIEDANVSDNFAQRLESTPRAEARGDWLWPHAQDRGEWLAHYGAGIAISRSDGVTVRRVTARRTQNGIVLDRVNRSRVYDNDCSFLSGWGLALWRSSGNVISRNAFDFCVRGYSHGVYNRGQDSAGILLFEQCSDNVIAENSVTHGGDGLFAFAGKEALGEVEPRREPSWYVRRGNNDNLIVGNDFSNAAAHGLELTFSFGNRIIGNTFTDNAICGIWGGYSQAMLIAGNRFEGNGEAGYGLERGGINIEHGRGNRIEHNDFTANRCAIHLWWDDDTALLATPWARANNPSCTENLVSRNRSRGDQTFLHLRNMGGVTDLGPNEVTDAGAEMRIEGDAPVERVAVPAVELVIPTYEAFGDTRPVGARAELAGRSRIVMTEWGPYDWASPRLHPIERASTHHELELLGNPSGLAGLEPAGDIEVRQSGTRIVVRPVGDTAVVPYTLTAVTNDGVRLEHDDLIMRLRWQVAVFASSVDPRTDEATWRNTGRRTAVTETLPELRLRYEGSGPAKFISAAEGFASDHFGTVAETRATLPAGRWRLHTVSDDGIRVWLDDDVVIDDWTWHTPRRAHHDFELDRPSSIHLRVEHFELDGYAVLEVWLEPR